MKYTATIRHHSISRAREIEIDGTLAQAKAAAAKEFRDEFLEHEIAVYETPGDRAPELVSTRRVGASTWNDC